MKRRLVLLFSAVALTACNLSSAGADEIDIDLKFADGFWSLYATVVDTESGVDGSLGVSSIRVLIDNIDYGTGGDAVTIATAIGASDPIATDMGDRPPVLQKSTGTLDILYSQDLNSTTIGNIGIGARDLIARGIYSGIAPAFGSNGSLTTQGRFLASGNNAIDSDANNLTASGLFLGDANDDGDLNNLDVEPFVQALTNPTAYVTVFPGVFLPAQLDMNSSGSFNGGDTPLFVACLVGGRKCPVASGAIRIVSVPEPSAVWLTILAACLSMVVRGPKRCQA